jgi:diphosphomevalonate decarboxylase
MKSSQPSIVYQTEDSIAVLKDVQQARKEGLEGYATMDAGSNVKILIQKKHLEAWKLRLANHFPFPIMVSRIGGRAHAE